MPKGQRKTIKEQVADVVRKRQQARDEYDAACKAVDALIEKMNEEIAELQAISESAKNAAEPPENISDEEICRLISDDVAKPTE